MTFKGRNLLSFPMMNSTTVTSIPWCWSFHFIKWITTKKEWSSRYEVVISFSPILPASKADGLPFTNSREFSIFPLPICLLVQIVTSHPIDCTVGIATQGRMQASVPDVIGSKLNGQLVPAPSQTR
jgi:hypothetical protein